MLLVPCVGESRCHQRGHQGCRTQQEVSNLHGVSLPGLRASCVGRTSCDGFPLATMQLWMKGAIAAAAVANSLVSLHQLNRQAESMPRRRSHSRGSSLVPCVLACGSLTDAADGDKRESSAPDAGPLSVFPRSIAIAEAAFVCGNGY